MGKNFCLITGAELNEGEVFSFKPKKMCLNCSDCKYNMEQGTYTCENDTNKLNAFEKLKAAVESADISGYSVRNLTTDMLEPIPLKKPTAKCAEWTLSQAVLQQFIDAVLGA